MVKKKDGKLNVGKNKVKKTATTKPSKTPIVWNPFNIMDNFDRIFMEDPWKPFWLQQRRPFIPWYETSYEKDVKITPLDLIDTGEKYKIIAELPGIQKKDLKVNVTDNSISICGETKSDTKKDDEGYLRRERSYSTICRNIRFPEEVNPDKADAKLNDGILEITVNKKKPSLVKGRNIPIK